MKAKAFLLGKIWGIPLTIDYSWFLIFGLITWLLAVQYYPVELHYQAKILYWLLAALTTLLLFGSILLHELGHAAAARYHGISVRRIRLLFFGGIAELGSEASTASIEFWIAIAGPAVSAGLALVFNGLAPFLTKIAPLFFMVKYLAIINGFVAIFNLLPGYPLDGGRVLRAIVWAMTKSARQATLMAATIGKWVAYFLIFVGIWQLFAGIISGLWLAILGWFLMGAAAYQIQFQQIQDRLAGHKVAELMTLAEPAALVSPEVCDLAAVCEPIGDHTSGAVQPDTELWEALRHMNAAEVNHLPVIVEGQRLGTLSRKAIVSFLQLDPMVPKNP